MVTSRALNRALLARQLLLEPVQMTPLAAIEHLVGLQAQTPNAPYIGLWTRLTDFTQGDLSDLITSRQAVRMVMMRSALHLVSARDSRAIRDLVQPGLADAFRPTWAERLRGAKPDDVAHAARVLAEHEPHTVAELAALLAERWPDAEPAALSAVVRILVPLVQTPPQGLWGVTGQAALVPAEQWIGPSLAPMSIEDLVKRYLAAYGPATVADMEQWSGLRGLREVTDRLGRDLVGTRGEDGEELLDLPDAPRPDPETPVAPCYLAEFDNVLVSHADRSRIMSDEYRLAVFAVPGVIPATVLVDGFVRGTWKITWHKGAATLVVRPLAQIPTKDVHALTEEGELLLQFAAPDATRHAVRFNSR